MIRGTLGYAFYFFFLISKGYALKKAKRRKAYRKNTRQLRPQKTKTKKSPPFKWKLSTLGSL